MNLRVPLISWVYFAILLVLPRGLVAWFMWQCFDVFFIRCLLKYALSHSLILSLSVFFLGEFWARFASYRDILEEIFMPTMFYIDLIKGMCQLVPLNTGELFRCLFLAFNKNICLNIRMHILRSDMQLRMVQMK